MTPGEFKSGGSGITIEWGVHPSPFGDALLGITPRGICHLTFNSDDSPDPQAALRERWPRAALRHQPESTGAVARCIFLSGDEDDTGSPAVSGDADRGTGRGGARREIRLLAGGTNFQVRVWDALLRIPPGEVTTYGEIARRIGRPSAARAAGSAIASNSIAYLIPCHRVIRRTGNLGGYRWGSDRKRALLAWEAAHTSEAAE
jgi:AraC family transcriptional regulator of adaptative response/methylated-DNA-[protein]-cysteine methyltransferase